MSLRDQQAYYLAAATLGQNLVLNIIILALPGKTFQVKNLLNERLYNIAHVPKAILPDGKDGVFDV